MQLNILLIFTFLSLLSCKTENKTVSNSSMIINGANWQTDLNDNDEFPYNSVFVKTNNACSGGYIAGQFVLTAAHCVKQLGDRDVIINRFGGGQGVRVWSRAPLAADNINDWAIFATSEPAGFSGGMAYLDFTPLKVGQDISTIAYPSQVPNTLVQSNGKIYDFLDNGLRYGHDADITVGSSGGLLGVFAGKNFLVNGIQSTQWWPNEASRVSERCERYVTKSCMNTAVSNKQFRHKIGELKSLESLQNVADLDGDGKKEFLVRSLNGIEVISLQQSNKVKLISSLKVGGSYDTWQFDQGEHIVFVADLDANGRSEILLRGKAGIVLIELQATGSWKVKANHKFDQQIGSFILDSNSNFVGVGDFLQKDKINLAVRNSLGLSLMSLGGNGLQEVSSTPLKTILANQWSFSDEDVFLGVLPLSQQTDRLLIRNYNNLGVMQWDSAVSQGAVKKYLTVNSQLYEQFKFLSDTIVIHVGSDTNRDGKSEFSLRGNQSIFQIDADFNIVSFVNNVFSDQDQLVGFLPITNQIEAAIIQGPKGIMLYDMKIKKILSFYEYEKNLDQWRFQRRNKIAMIGNIIERNDAVYEFLIRGGEGYGVFTWDANANGLKVVSVMKHGATDKDYQFKYTDYIPAR